MYIVVTVRKLIAFPAVFLILKLDDGIAKGIQTGSIVTSHTYTEPFFVKQKEGGEGERGNHYLKTTIF